VLQVTIVTLEMYYRVPYEVLRKELIAKYGYEWFAKMQSRAFHEMLHSRHLENCTKEVA